jgi:CRISPR-associated protein Cas2
MKVLVVYDIFDDKRRRKVAKFLYSYSHSYQKSALELEVSKSELKKIYKRLISMIEKEDKLFIFEIKGSICLGECNKVEFII